MSALNDKPQKKMFRAKDIVDIYSVSRSTVWLYAKEGKITPIKISPRITLFNAKEVENFFNKDD